MTIDFKEQGLAAFQCRRVVSRSGHDLLTLGWEMGVQSLGTVLCASSHAGTRTARTRAKGNKFVSRCFNKVDQQRHISPVWTRSSPKVQAQESGALYHS